MLFCRVDSVKPDNIFPVYRFIAIFPLLLIFVVFALISLECHLLVISCHLNLIPLLCVHGGLYFVIATFPGNRHIYMIYRKYCFRILLSVIQLRGLNSIP